MRYNFPMANTNKIIIVGVSDDGAEGLTKQAADCIQGASVLVGTPGLLAKFPNFRGSKEIIGGDLDRLANAFKHTSLSAEARETVM